MEFVFFAEFIVPKSFVFSSHDEFSKVASKCYYNKRAKVKITNSVGQILQGYLLSDTTVIENIKTVAKGFGMKNNSSFTYTWMNNNLQGLKIPTIPSPLKKRVGREYFLFYRNHHEMIYIMFAPRAYLKDKDYLIATLMPAENGKDFDITDDCKIEVVE